MQMPTKRSVIGIVLDPSHAQVLLIKRRDVSIWVLPGGGVEAHETPENAVVREVYEETGLKVVLQRQVALYTPINRLASDTYVFDCQPISGELATGDETQQVGFFPLTALPKPLFFLHREWLADAQQHHPEVIFKALTQVTYWKLFKYLCLHPVQVVRFMLSRLGKPINTR